MTGLKDRHGRGLSASLGGRGGAAALTPRLLEASLRLRRALAGRPGLCGRGVEKLLGFRPSRLELRLWNGRRLLLNLPPDLPNFLSDFHGVILRDQYDAGDLAGRVVADAGANIGLFTLYVLALGARKVHAFEPVAETLAMLKANLALNRAGRRVRVHGFALGAAEGGAELLCNTGGEGSARLAGPVTDASRGVTYACRRPVAVRPLDAVIKGKVDFIKIDTEGAEGEVLKGAAGLIRRFKPALSVAAYHRRSDRKTLPALLRRLRPDYRIELNKFAEQDLACR